MEQAQFSLQVHASRAVNPVFLSLLVRQERKRKPSMQKKKQNSFQAGGKSFLTGARFLCC